MSFYARISLTIIFIFACGYGSDAFSQRRRRAPRPAPRHVLLPPVTANLSAEQKRRVESFDKAWRTIFHYYFDPKFNNVDWGAVKTEYEPKVLAAKSDEQLHELLDTMIGRLKVSHLGIIRPSVYEAIETAKETARERAAQRRLERAAGGGASGEDEEDDLNFDDPLSIYGPGFDLRIIGNRFVVFRVAKDSSAEYGGIRPGYIIESIDDVSLSLLLARISLLEKGESRVLRYLPVEVVREMLNGAKDSTVKIGYVDENEETKDIEIRRERLRTQSVSMGSDVPDNQLYFESRSIDSDTGYIHFDNFSLPVIEKFCAALTDFKEKKSLVIDLRGNLGGVIGVSTGLAGMLADKPMNMGTSILRYGSEPLLSQPKAKRFSGNIVVLTDGLSVSAAEMFAVALQSSGRAQVIGERSAGETLPAVAVELPTGARLYYPIANFRAPNGKFLEGDGVVPDKVVILDRTSLVKGVDPQLAAAIATLKSATTPARSGIGGTPPVELSGPVNNTGSAKNSGGMGNAVAPPPPPPKALKNLGTVTVKAPAEPRDPPNLIEPKALELLTEFEKLSGGHAAYEAISSYEMAGSVETVSMGSRDIKEYRAVRDGTARQMTVFHSRAMGEIKDVRDGKKRSLKSDFGVELEIPFAVPVDKSDFIFVITEAMKPDNYVKLMYLGVFDRKDRKVHLIDGKTKDGTTVAIYFDTETKMLAGYEGPSGGLSFADYRKVGNLMMPHNISSQDFLDIRLNEIKLNTKIDPAVFERKVNCYDTPN